MAPVWALDQLAASGAIAPDWVRALEPVAADIAALGERIIAENASGRVVLPPLDRVFRAFSVPLAEVRVLILGQDPYPTPGHAMGLAFATEPGVRPLPRSVRNIYRELHDDLGIEPAPHADLTRWSEQGVLLLNRVLTVEAGLAGSHRKWGWERITDQAIKAVFTQNPNCISVLWGKQAQQASALVNPDRSIVSAHPSPLSASRGFFGSRPFSGVNALLSDSGDTAIDWRLP